MNRRTALRHVAIISAGAALLPSCVHDDAASLPLQHIKISAAQERMLAALTETIIPSTASFTGAGDLRSHTFVLTMVDDCNSPADQQRFITGMKSFDEGCKQKWGHSFVNCNTDERKQYLGQLEQKTAIPETTLAFYEMTKRYTVQSFTTSKEYMTTIRNYKMVPGNNFRGCVPVA